MAGLEAMECDAHLLVAKLHRRALILGAAHAGRHFQGCGALGRHLRLASVWQKRLVAWDAALGLTEKITVQSVNAYLADLEGEILRCLAAKDPNISPVLAPACSPGELTTAAPSPSEGLPACTTASGEQENDGCEGRHGPQLPI